MTSVRGTVVAFSGHVASHPPTQIGATDSDDLLLEPGSRVDEKYVVEKLVGFGAMGTVYAATHIFLRGRVAIKVPNAPPSVLARFRREVQVAATLSHRNLCRVLDCGSIEGRPYMVMEWLEGETVAKLVRVRPLLLEHVVVLASQLLTGLVALHGAGLIHRDIKPANIMVTNPSYVRFQVKLLDFGLTKPTDRVSWGPGVDITRTGMRMGTPQYMSPEAVHGRELDARSDVYSVGAVLFHALTGAAPFKGKGAELLLRISQGEVTPMESLAPVPDAVAAIVRKAMHIDPAARFADAHAFLEAVTRLGEEPEATTTTGSRTIR